MQKPIAEVRLKNDKNPKNPKLFTNISQVEVDVEVTTTATKIEEATSTPKDVAVEAKEEAATGTDFNVANDAHADNVSGEGSEDQRDGVDTNLNTNFNNCKQIDPFGGVILEYMTDQVTENPTLISPDNIPNIETIKGTIDTKVETKKDNNNSHNDKANTIKIQANHKHNTLVHIP